MSSTAQPTAAPPVDYTIPYPDFDPSCLQAQEHKIGVYCSSCEQCGMPWHNILPFPGSEDPDEVMEGEETVIVGPVGSVLEDVHLKKAQKIHILTLIISYRLGPPFKSAQLDAASKQDSFESLDLAANRIINMAKTLNEQAEREDCYCVAWYHILNDALRWPLESADALMESFYKPSSLKKDLPKVPVVDPSAPVFSSGWTAVSSTRAESAPPRTYPREIRDSQDERDYIDENENNDPISDIDGSHANEDNQDGSPSDPNDFTEYGRKYAENEDFDLHTAPKNGAAGTKWVLTEGQDWSPAQLNKPDCSKFVVFRSSADGKIHEIRQLPWWADFDWSDPDHMTGLVKWRSQLKGRSGGDKKPKGCVWTQKEKDACLKFSEEVIAAGEVTTRSAFFDIVTTKMEAHFRELVQKMGEQLADMDQNDMDEEDQGTVLKEDRLGHTRGGKTISNVVSKSFTDINLLVNAFLKDAKKKKSVADKEKKSKTKKKGKTEQAEEDAEDGGEPEGNRSPGKKGGNKRKSDELENEYEVMPSKPKKARTKAPKKIVNAPLAAASGPVPETPSPDADASLPAATENQGSATLPNADESAEGFEVQSPETQK